jgi:lysophospholipase L1-like esterase
MSDTRTEANDPFVIDNAEAARLLQGASWRRFAVLGDSVAEGIGDPSPGYTTSPWADRVATALRAGQPDLEYLNTGRMGATTRSVIRYQLDRIVEFAPDLVYITCGINDVWQAGADIEALAHNLDHLFRTVANSGAQIGTVAFADAFVGPMGPLRSRVHTLNEIVRELAQDYDATLVDLWEHPFRLRTDLFSADLIHFAMSGHAVVATETIKALSAAAQPQHRVA